MSSPSRTLVVKVGGSLYDLGELRTLLPAWLEQQAADEIILVPGGGALVDAIRAWDRLHDLGEETCHWLALRALAVNARFLARLLPDAPIIDDVVRRRPGLAILDGCAFAQADEARPGKLPHCWTVTSDSLALRAALLVPANLVLLKSVDVPAEISWSQAAQRGIVDEYFCRIAPAALPCRIENLRAFSARRQCGTT